MKKIVDKDREMCEMCTPKHDPNWLKTLGPIEWLRQYTAAVGYASKLSHVHNSHSRCPQSATYKVCSIHVLFAKFCRWRYIYIYIQWALASISNERALGRRRQRGRLSYASQLMRLGVWMVWAMRVFLWGYSLWMAKCYSGVWCIPIPSSTRVFWQDGNMWQYWK